MEFPKSDLWNYSTQLWTLPGIESICLELQSSHAADVNLLLYCCWAGEQQRKLTDINIRSLLKAADSWQTIIKPLRESRKLMQQNLIAMPPDLVDQTLHNIVEMELNAEHMEQLALDKALALEALTACEESVIECSLINLKTYMQTLEQASGNADSTPAISQLLSSIHQDEEAVQMALMTAMASG